MTRPKTILAFSILLALGCTGASDQAVAPPPPPPTPAAPAPPPAVPAAPEQASVALYQETPYVRADLEKMALRELSLRRNTIYARAGNPFRKKWLNDYFSAQPWYHPAAATDFSKLTQVDRKNAKMIGNVEASFSREELLRRKAVLGELSAITDPDLRIEYQLLTAALGDGATGDRNPLEDPDMLDRELTDAQLADLSRRDLRLLRNTVFARHGRPFKSPLMKEYFAQKAWYTADPGYDESRLTAVDKKNVEKIVALEESLGGMMTDAEEGQKAAGEDAEGAAFAGA